ncbi:Thiazole synthase, partial [Clarias magur]
MMFSCKCILLPREPGGDAAQEIWGLVRNLHCIQRSVGCAQHSIEMNDQIEGITVGKPATEVESIFGSLRPHHRGLGLLRALLKSHTDR